MTIKIYADRSYESPNLPTYYVGEVNGERMVYAATPWEALRQARLWCKLLK